MKNEIVKIDAAEYGLEETKAKEIEALFTPMLAKMTELEKEYNKVVKLEMNKETCAKAKELRLRYVKVRTGTAEIHKGAKAFYLAGGKFVDGWKNAQIFASSDIEEKLMAIEKHQENVEKERIQNLQDSRTEEILKYVESEMMIPSGIGEMDEAVWKPYLQSVKDAFKIRKDAEKKAEEDRLENIRLDGIERGRKLEIAPYLQFLNDQKDLRVMSDKDYTDLIGSLKTAKSDYDTEQEKIRKENERLQKERRLLEKKAVDEKEKRRLAAIDFLIENGFENAHGGMEAKNHNHFIESLHYSDFDTDKEFEMFKSDVLKTKEIEELKDKRELEEKQQKEDEKAEKAALLAPDKDKLEILAKGLAEFPLPELDTKDAAEIISNVKILLGKVTTYIREKKETL